MAKKYLKVTIDEATGESEIEAIGFKGKGCALEINKLLKEIGGKEIESKLKKEYRLKEKEKSRA